MRELTYKNQHEIGFDIDCLPAWVNYISMGTLRINKGHWWAGYHTEPRATLKNWETQDRLGAYVIPDKYTPKKFSGNWKESLFKINRESSAHYNGTAI